MLPQACLNVLTGNSWGYLWYLYTLIGLYLVLPVISSFVDKVDRQTCIIFSMFMFLFCFLIPVVNRLFRIKVVFEMPIASYALFNFIVGKLLYTSNNQILNKKRIWGCTLAVLALLLLIINFYDGSDFLGYNSPIIAGISICHFLLLKGTKIKASGQMWKIDRLCFDAYLIHSLFVNFLYKFLKIMPLNFGDAYMVGEILLWIIFVIITFVAGYIMNLIKPLKNTFYRWEINDKNFEEGEKYK